jgi:hypothetical protein
LSSQAAHAESAERRHRRFDTDTIREARFNNGTMKRDRCGIGCGLRRGGGNCDLTSAFSGIAGIVVSFV